MVKNASFFMDSVPFCGHEIDKDGLHKTEEKICAVVNAKNPNKRTEGPESRTDGETLIFWD